MAAFDPKRHVGVHPERVSHVSSTDYPGHDPTQDHTWNLAKFQQVCPSLALAHMNSPLIRDWPSESSVSRTAPSTLISSASMPPSPMPSDAFSSPRYVPFRACRRVDRQAQVPTVCIERAYIWCNTSVIADEVLAHRLGLVPLNVDPALLDLKDREHPHVCIARTRPSSPLS